MPVDVDELPFYINLKLGLGLLYPVSLVIIF
jgi:hypothetical protein